MRRSLLALLLASAVTACADPPSAPPQRLLDPTRPALGVDVSQFHDDVGPITTLNPCVPEDVIFSGKVHTTTKRRADGTTELRTNFADLKGVGVVTGDEYRLQQNSHTIIVDDLPPPVFTTTEFHTRVTSKGSGDNFDLVVERTVFIDPPNAPVITNNVIRSECRG